VFYRLYQESISVAVHKVVLGKYAGRLIREKTGLLQAKFAALLGVSVRTLQDWEQQRRAPSGAARTLLLIANRNPSALLEVA